MIEDLEVKNIDKEEDKSKKFDDLKQKAKASMLKLKHKRDDEGVEDDKDVKKRAIEEVVVTEKSNELEIQNPAEEAININQNVEMKGEDEKIQNETEDTIKGDDDPRNTKKIQEAVENVNPANENIIPVISDPNIPSFNQTSNLSPPILSNVISNTPTGSNIPSNVSTQKEEAQGKAKKISFSEAKKEIEEFTSQLEKYEQEIKSKYGVNLSEFYVEDLLPEELKIKLIEDFFNSEEINEITKKLI
jgi:hypothetical protein